MLTLTSDSTAFVFVEAASASGVCPLKKKFMFRLRHIDVGQDLEKSTIDIIDIGNPNMYCIPGHFEQTGRLLLWLASRELLQHRLVCDKQPCASLTYQTPKPKVIDEETKEYPKRITCEMAQSYTKIEVVDSVKVCHAEKKKRKKIRNNLKTIYI